MKLGFFFLGISPTFHQPVTFVALGSTGAPACNFATQSSSEWPSLPAPASGGWDQSCMSKFVAIQGDVSDKH